MFSALFTKVLPSSKVLTAYSSAPSFSARSISSSASKESSTVLLIFPFPNEIAASRSVSSASTHKFDEKLSEPALCASFLIRINSEYLPVNFLELSAALFNKVPASSTDSFMSAISFPSESPDKASSRNKSPSEYSVGESKLANELFAFCNGSHLTTNSLAYSAYDFALV